MNIWRTQTLISWQILSLLSQESVSEVIMMCPSPLATPRAGKKESAFLVLSPSKTTGGRRWFLKGNWGDFGEGMESINVPPRGHCMVLQTSRGRHQILLNQTKCRQWAECFIFMVLFIHNSLSRRMLLSPSSRQGDGTSHTSSNLPRSSWKVIELIFKFKSVEFQGPYFVPHYQPAKTEPLRNGIAFCFDEIKFVKKSSLRERDKNWRGLPNVLPLGNVPESYLTSLVQKEVDSHRQKGQHKHTKKESFQKWELPKG